MNTECTPIQMEFQGLGKQDLPQNFLTLSAEVEGEFELGPCWFPGGSFWLAGVAAEEGTHAVGECVVFEVGYAE